MLGRGQPGASARHWELETVTVLMGLLCGSGFNEPMETELLKAHDHNELGQVF